MGQYQIDKVSDIKPGRNGQVSSKIHSGNDYFYINADGTPYVGKTVQFDIEEKTSAKGNKYRIAHNLKVIEAAAAANGGIAWADYFKMASIAHALARTLEPDEMHLEPVENGGTAVKRIDIDRSQARAAILNTCMIAFANGKIALPDENEADEMPF